MAVVVNSRLRQWTSHACAQHVQQALLGNHGELDSEYVDDLSNTVRPRSRDIKRRLAAVFFRETLKLALSSEVHKGTIHAVTNSARFVHDTTAIVE